MSEDQKNEVVASPVERLVMWLFPRLREQPNEIATTEPKEVVKVNTLTIKTKDGNVLTWSNNPFHGTNKLTPWRPFYKWYFGRDNSECFIMHYTTGETMIRKEDIVSFS